MLGLPEGTEAQMHGPLCVPPTGLIEWRDLTGPMAGERGNGVLPPSCGGLRVDSASHTSKTGLGFWLGESWTFMVLSKEACIYIHRHLLHYILGWGSPDLS